MPPSAYRVIAWDPSIIDSTKLWKDWHNQILFRQTQYFCDNARWVESSALTSRKTSFSCHNVYIELRIWLYIWSHVLSHRLYHERTKIKFKWVFTRKCRIEFSNVNAFEFQFSFNGSPILIYILSLK